MLPAGPRAAVAVVATKKKLTGEDQRVLGEIHRMRKEMRQFLRTPRRWEGGFAARLAKAVQGSNSIEGYVVAEDDALAALDEQAQTTARRFEDAGRYGTHLDGPVTAHCLPGRAMDALFDALLGYRVRRSGSMKRAQTEGRTATRDLAQSWPAAGCSPRTAPAGAGTTPPPARCSTFAPTCGPGARRWSTPTPGCGPGWRSPSHPGNEPLEQGAGPSRGPVRRGHQPRSRHSRRCGRSSPSVVSFPWPG